MYQYILRDSKYKIPARIAQKLGIAAGPFSRLSKPAGQILKEDQIYTCACVHTARRACVHTARLKTHKTLQRLLAHDRARFFFFNFVALGDFSGSRTTFSQNFHTTSHQACYTSRYLYVHRKKKHTNLVRTNNFDPHYNIYTDSTKKALPPSHHHHQK